LFNQPQNSANASEPLPALLAEKYPMQSKIFTNAVIRCCQVNAKLISRKSFTGKLEE